MDLDQYFSMGDHWNLSKDIFACHKWGKGCYLVAKSVTKHVTILSTDPTTKNDLAQNVRKVEFDNPWIR